MNRLFLLFTLLFAGCVAPLPKPVTDLSAVVIRYNETIPLGTPRREKPFYTVELEIVAPMTLEGRKLLVISKDPLPTDNLFRKSGARLRLAVIAFEESRGTSMLLSEGIFRTEYKVMITNITMLGEELNSISPFASPR